MSPGEIDMLVDILLKLLYQLFFETPSLLGNEHGTVGEVEVVRVRKENWRYIPVKGCHGLSSQNMALSITLQSRR
jgi:hypothetical protein